jgi:hypothetical protein
MLDNLFIKVDIISIFTGIALSLLSTLGSIKILCSAKAYDIYLKCRFSGKVTICDLKNYAPSFVSWSIKSLGKHVILRVSEQL